MEIYEKPLGLLRYYSIVFGQRADNELAKYFPNSLTTGWFGCAKGIYIGNWKLETHSSRVFHTQLHSDPD